jgi:hypothetical protein
VENKNNTQLDSSPNNGSLALKIINGLFGLLAFSIGIVNAFWGNPAGFGIFIMLLSLVYFLPIYSILKRILGFQIPRLGIIKVLLALFILWAALGVGELFNKIETMLNYFQA